MTRDERAESILRASVPVFASLGYRGASMSKIADAAGVSRPALYQYFRDRSDLFAAAFRLLLEEATDEALRALGASRDLDEQLDGYLQRLSGDAYEALASAPCGDELLEAKHQFAADAATAAVSRAHDGLRTHLRDHGVSTNACDQTFELLTLAPVGLKQDRPSPTTYRRRLRYLAQAAAATLREA